MSAYEVRGELDAQLLESIDGAWCLSTRPNPCRALQRGWECPTHDLVWYPLKVHQGLESL